MEIEKSAQMSTSSVQDINENVNIEDNKVQADIKPIMELINKYNSKIGNDNKQELMNNFKDFFKVVSKGYMNNFIEKSVKNTFMQLEEMVMCNEPLLYKKISEQTETFMDITISKLTYHQMTTMLVGFIDKQKNNLQQQINNLETLNNQQQTQIKSTQEKNDQLQQEIKDFYKNNSNAQNQFLAQIEELQQEKLQLSVQLQKEQVRYDTDLAQYESVKKEFYLLKHNFNNKVKEIVEKNTLEYTVQLEEREKKMNQMQNKVIELGTCLQNGNVKLKDNAMIQKEMEKKIQQLQNEYNKIQKFNVTQNYSDLTPRSSFTDIFQLMDMPQADIQKNRYESTIQKTQIMKQLLIQEKRKIENNKKETRKGTQFESKSNQKKSLSRMISFKDGQQPPSQRQLIVNDKDQDLLSLPSKEIESKHTIVTEEPNSDGSIKQLQIPEQI